jgi:hypothetical protein
MGERVMGTDWNAKGQHDRERAREDGWVDLLIGGGGSPHDNPPFDPDDKEEYDAGWENASARRSECRWAETIALLEQRFQPRNGQARSWSAMVRSARLPADRPRFVRTASVHN